MELNFLIGVHEIHQRDDGGLKITWVGAASNKCLRTECFCFFMAKFFGDLWIIRSLLFGTTREQLNQGGQSTEWRLYKLCTVYCIDKICNKTIKALFMTYLIITIGKRFSRTNTGRTMIIRLFQHNNAVFRKLLPDNPVNGNVSVHNLSCTGSWLQQKGKEVELVQRTCWKWNKFVPENVLLSDSYMVNTKI